MPTTWTIAVDWDRSGDFDGMYSDVTSYALSAEWVLGMQQVYQGAADNSVLHLVLNNADKRFSPENASSPLAGKLLPFRPIRVQSNDGTTTRTHWIGWIETIQPTEGMYGERLTHVTATGSMQFLKATETQLKLQQGKRTDEIIGELIKEVVMPPALSRAWVVGQVGHSELDLSAYLADTSLYSSLEQGILTLALAADNWVNDGGPSNISKNSFDVYQAIQDITAAENGKFLFDREGKAIFWNRHHLLQDDTSVATFDNTMTDMAYAYASIEQTKNEVIVTCHPRTIGTTTNDVLWQLGDAVIMIDPAKTREVYVKYEDENGKRISGQDVTVTDLEFESGAATATVEGQANGAQLKFVNTGSSPAVVKKCIVRGKKITDSGQMETKAIEQDSINKYGRRTLRINLPSIDNLEQAQYIADFERDRRAQPLGLVTALTVLSHAANGGTHHAQQLALTLGDLITISEAQTGHSANHFIIGEAHELAEQGRLWKTTWFLEPAPKTYPWRLDGTETRSKLGQNTFLAY